MRQPSPSLGHPGAAHEAGIGQTCPTQWRTLNNNRPIFSSKEMWFVCCVAVSNIHSLLNQPGPGHCALWGT